MEALSTPFLPSFSPILHNPNSKANVFAPPPKLKPKPKPILQSSDRWTLSDGPNKPYPRIPRKKPLSDDDARRIIAARAAQLSRLRRNQGPHAQAPRWIRRTPDQMARLLADDRDGHVHGKHVVAAIRTVRGLAGRPEGSYDMREVMGQFVTRLTFREMCAVLKEQRGWRPARDFFAWMKLQLCYRPCVIVYTIILKVYGQVGKVKLAEQTFLEMLDAGCEPDEVACGTMLCIYARWGRHKEMLTFYDAVMRREILPSVGVFNFMISSLQKRKLHAEVIKLWKQMLDAGAEPNQFTYTIAVSSYIKEDLLDEALQIFYKMRNSKLIPEEATYSLLISSTSKSGKWDKALGLYEDMRSQGIIPSNYTCASLLTLYYKTGDYPRALSLLSEIEKNKIALDEVIYGILIRIYGKLGLYEDAEKTFQTAESLGLFKDEKTYMAMVHVHLNARSPDKALETFDLMRQRNVELTTFSQHALLRCYIAKEDVVSAEKTFQTLLKVGKLDAVSCSEMLALYFKLNLLEKAKALISQIRKDVQFDENLYRTVVQVYCKTGMSNEVEELVEEMGNAGMVLDKFTKTSLMIMYGDAGMIHSVERLFETLEVPDMTALSVMVCLYIKNGGIVRSKEILRSLLETNGGLSLVSQLIIKFVKEGDTVSAEALHRQIIELDYKPTDPAVASLISLYARRQQLHQAEGIFAVISNSPEIWSLSYCSMVDAYTKCGEVEKAYLLFRRIFHLDVVLSPFTISMIVNALTKHGKFEEAESIINDTLKAGVELDTVAYNTYIKAMLEAGKLHLASRIYDQMVSSGIPPSIQTYNTMISVYGQGGKLDNAVQIFSAARNMGISFDEKAYTNMISYYGKSGMAKDAALLFHRMQEEGIRPGKISYNVMLNAYATTALHEDAEGLVKLMRQAGHTPDGATYLALLRAYINCEEYVQGEEIIHRMRKDGLFPSCAHFNQLILAHIKNGSVSDAERICSEMQQFDLSPDLTCCRSMLRAYMDHGFVDKGISLYQSIKGTVKPDGFILSAAVHLFMSKGKVSEAREVTDFMNSRGIVFIRSLRIGLKGKVTANIT